MTSDGISSQDWDQVHELALALANARDDEDAPYRERLLTYLRELISKYGELPSLLATQADYTGDSHESERLLLRAFDLAVGIQDRSNLREISLSLADLYLSDLHQWRPASRWLEIANAYIEPTSEIDRSEYDRIELAIAILRNRAG